jgi:hypothetical protein
MVAQIRESMNGPAEMKRGLRWDEDLGGFWCKWINSLVENGAEYLLVFEKQNSALATPPPVALARTR